MSGAPAEGVLQARDVAVSFNQPGLLARAMARGGTATRWCTPWTVST